MRFLPPDYVDYLSGLPADRMGALLRARPDAAASPQPLSVAELASRLHSAGSVARAAQGLDTTSLGLLAVLSATAGITHGQLVAWLSGNPAEDVDGSLMRLMDVGLVYPGEAARHFPPPGSFTANAKSAPMPAPGGSGAGSSGAGSSGAGAGSGDAGKGAATYFCVDVEHLLPDPMRLGGPAAQLLELGTTSDQRRRIFADYGLECPPTVAGQVALLVRLRDRDWLLRAVSGLTDAARSALSVLATEGPRVTSYRPMSYGATSYGGAQYRSGEPLDELESAGIVYRRDYDYLELPREYGLILRERSAPPQLAPAPLPLLRQAIDQGHADAQAAHALAEFTRHAGEILRDISVNGLVRLKSTGAAVRDVRRLAKTLSVSEEVVAMILGVCRSTRLIDPGHPEDRVWLLTSSYDEFARAPLAEQAARLVLGWLSCPEPLTRRHFAGEDKPGPVLGDKYSHPGLFRIRASLLGLLAGDDGAAGDANDDDSGGRRGGGSGSAGRDAACPTEAVSNPADAVATAYWRRPIPADRVGGVDQLRAQLLEMQLLGMVDTAAVSELGWLLHTQVGAAAPVATARDDSAARHDTAAADDLGPKLAELCARWLPAEKATVRLQADLTAVVLGTPAADVFELLDAAAERETRGQGSIWRFTPASLRAYLDTGADGQTLLEELARIGAPLPQPLLYQIQDSIRRHGHVSVTEVRCVLVADDDTLLLELLAANGLKNLQLRRLAPTVLASPAPPETVLEKLRAKGYSPVLRDGDGAVVFAATARPRVERDQNGARIGPVPGPASARRDALEAALVQVEEFRAARRAAEPAIDYAVAPAPLPAAELAAALTGNEGAGNEGAGNEGAGNEGAGPVGSAEPLGAVGPLGSVCPGAHARLQEDPLLGAVIAKVTDPGGFSPAELRLVAHAACYGTPLQISYYGRDGAGAVDVLDHVRLEGDRLRGVSREDGQRQVMHISWIAGVDVAE